MKLKFYFLASAFLFLLNIHAQTISTVVGGGSDTLGDGGLATNAQLKDPSSVCIDKDGNIFFSEENANRIRRVDAITSLISTIAGTGGSGGYSGDGGLAINAKLDHPAGISIDGLGNLYFADSRNHCIRKITASTGIINTIAGNGTSGFSGDGGLAVDAQLFNPYSVYLDASNNIYIPDFLNDKIRKIDASTGIINTIAGIGYQTYSGDGGPALNAGFYNPYSLCFDANENIFISDSRNHRIRKINASTGIITTIAGTGIAGFSGDGGLAVNAKLNEPQDILVDADGNVFITDTYNYRVRKVNSSTGIITTVAGTGNWNGVLDGDGAIATNSDLGLPKGIAMDRLGNLYIAAVLERRIRKVNLCPIPSLQTNVIGNTIVCPGSIYKYSIKAANATSYAWTLPSNWTGSSTADSITVIAGSTIGNVTVKANSVCGSSPVQILPIEKSGIPNQPASINGSTVVCPGTNSYSIAPVNGATSYTWTLPTGWTGTSTTTSINAVADTNIGNITVKANNICGSSINRVLTITHNKVLPALDSIIGTSVVCPNDTNTYSVLPVTGATTYTWTLPSGWSGTSITPSINAISDTSIGNITVTASNACSSTPVQTLNIVRNGSLPSIGAITGNISVCPGSDNTYSIPPVPGATDYIWTLPPGWGGSYNSNTLNATAGITGNITVKAYNKCDTTLIQSLKVTVNSNVPPAQPDTINGLNSVCSGSTQTYNIKAIPGAKSYTWTLPSGWSGSSTSNSISVTVGSASGIIKVKANNFCSSSPEKMLNVTVSSTAPSQPDPIMGDTAICQGSVNAYLVMPSSNVTSYVWTLPLGWSGNSSTNLINVLSDTTSGIISVKAVNGCGNSIIQSLSVNAYVPVDASISRNGGTLTANISGASYQWIDCDSMTSVAGATSQVFTPMTSGNFAVVISKNGCADTSECMSINPTGINASSKKAIFSIYPNPNNGNMTLEYALPKSGVFELYDLVGRKVLNYNLNSGINKLLIHAENLQNGIYFYQLKAEGNLILKDKIIIQN